MSARPLSKELQRKADHELNENQNRIQSDLEHLREWIAKQSHLKIRTDDQWLISMMRGCKYSLERTKEKMDLLCTMKSVCPEFYANRDPFLPEIQEILKLGLCIPLPKTTDPAAPRVVLFRIESADPAKLRIENGIKVILMILDILLNEDDNFVVAGCHLFIDDRGVSVNHMLQLTPTIVKKAHTCLNDAYALRPKGFHAIHVPQFAEMTYNMFKSILNEKNLNRVHIYKNDDFDEIYKVIPLSVLPKEYGGNGGSLEELTLSWKKKVESYRDWFLDDAQYSSDETKRPGKPKTSGDLFGIEGSFRKLDFD